MVSKIEIGNLTIIWPDKVSIDEDMWTKLRNNPLAEEEKMMPKLCVPVEASMDHRYHTQSKKDSPKGPCSLTGI